MTQFAIYYIGGPWDLHKVAAQREPGRTEIIRAIEPRWSAKPTDPIEWQDYEYRLMQVASRIFVAVHEDSPQ